MGKPNSLSRRSGEEKSSIDAKFFEAGQLRDLGEDENVNAYNAEDIELEGIDLTQWDRHNGLWLVLQEHRLKVLPQHHDSQVAEHCGKYIPQELVSRNFKWYRWSEDVSNYVAGYIKCQRSKADRRNRQTNLRPMPTGEQAFGEIGMDFVDELPESEGFYAILVVRDRFTKAQHYVPPKTTWIAADVENAFINDIWRPHGLLRHITNDRGPQLTSKFSKAMTGKLNIYLLLSTAYHPQTDGLRERSGKTLLQHLRICCNDRQCH